MRRRPLPVLLAAAALSASALGCADDQAGTYFGTTTRSGKDPATFYVNNAAEPEYIDPGKSYDTVSVLLALQLFEGLTVYGPDGHPAQGVATRWEQSDDNRVFRFHLRPEAAWSDGKPVVAGDFEYAWKRVLRPATGAQQAEYLYPLKNGELFAQGKLRAASRDLVLRTGPREGDPEAGRLPKGTLVRIADVPEEKGAAKTRDPKAPVLVERYDDLPTFVPRAPAGARGAEPPPKPPGTKGFADPGDLVEDASVVGVRAADDHTLEVELERPTPYFIDLTGHPSLAPVRKDIVEPFEQRGEPDLWTRPENIVVNGPYTLDDWKFRYEITMKVNPHYWNRDALRIRRIVWLEVEEYHATMNLYKAGDLDYVGDNVALPAEYMPLLETKKDFLRSDYLATFWYEFNTAVPPVDDERVRRALDLAVDKRQLVDKVTRGGQTPATHYVPDFTGLGYSAQVAADRAAGTDPFTGPGAEFDPERARALLKEAGYAIVRDGDGYQARGFPPLEVLYNTSEGLKLMAVAIQDMWKKNLGVSATLRNEEWKVMLKDVRDRHFQVVRSGWVADYDHPSTWLDTFLSTSAENHTGWSSPAFDALMRQAAATADTRQSIQLYRKAEAVAVAGRARLPLYFYTKSTMVKPWVRGFAQNPRSTHLVRYLWIDPDWQSHPDAGPACPPMELPEPGRIAGPGQAP